MACSASSDQPQPTISLYRRMLQRNYVTLLLVASGSVKDPSEASDAIDSPRDRGSMRLDGVSLAANVTSSLAETGRQYQSAPGRPSEFRAALRLGVNQLSAKLEKGAKKVRDPETAAHLKDLRAELDKVP